MHVLYRLLFLLACSLAPPAAAQSFIDQGMLPLNADQEGRLAPGEVHLWVLEVVAGDYLVVDVEQPDADLTLYVLKPDASFYTYAETPTGPGATQQARWIADTTGIWQLRLRPVADSVAARYALTWKVQRPATSLDKEVVSLDSLDSISSAYYERGDYARIDSLLEHMLGVAEEALGPEDLAVANLLNRQAVLWIGQGETEKAQVALERALAIQQKATSASHPETASTLSNMAQVAMELGRYDEAVSLRQQVLAIREQFPGPALLRLSKAQANLASAYQALGRYAEADSLYQRSLELAEPALGEDSPQVMATLNNIARLRADQGLYEEADSLYQRVLGLREQAYGPVHADVALTLNNLAWVQQVQGGYKEAQASYERALAIWTQTLGPEHPDLGYIYNALGNNYYAQDRYAEADSLYRQALALEEQVLGPEHPRLAGTLNNIAFLAVGMGRIAEADTLYQRAVAIRAKALGPDHPQLAILLGNIAQSYQQVGQYRAAEEALQRALRIYAVALGPDHPDRATFMNSLASMYTEQARYAEADSLYGQALRILEQTHGPDHVEVGQTLNNQALLYDAQGRYRDVESHYRRALEIFQATYGPYHSEVATVLNNIALKLLEQGRFAEAEPMLQRALEIDVRVLGPEHYVVALRYANRGALRADQGRYAEAERDFQRALTVLEAVFGPDHSTVAYALNKLAGVYINQKRYAEAEPLLQRALSIREKVYGEQHPDVAATLNDVAVLYTKQEKLEQAEPLYQQALDILAATSGPTTLNYVSGLNNLAATLTSLERYEDAHATFEQAARVFEEHIGADHPAAAVTQLGQAEAYQADDRPQEALGAINRALERFEAVRGYAPVGHARAYVLRARIHHDLGQLDDALDDMEEALERIEMLRPEIGGGEQTRARFLETYAEAFDDITAWYLEAGDPERALEYTERGRARVLLDQLALAGLDLWEGLPGDVRSTLETRDADARARLAEFQQRLTLVYAEDGLSERDRIYKAAALQDSLALAERSYEQVYRDLKNANPRWRDAFLNTQDPVDLRRVQRSLVPDDGMLLLYQIGETSSHVFMVPPGRADMEVYPLVIDDEVADALGMTPGPFTASLLRGSLTMPPDELSRAPGLLQRLATGAAPSEVQDPVHAVWQILVPDTLRARLLAAPDVLLVPDEGLHFLPFEALVVEPATASAEAQYWLDVGPVIRYAPSLTTLYNLSQATSSDAVQATSVLSLSDPIYDPAVVAEQGGSPDEPALIADASVSARTRYADRGGTFAPLPGTARESRAIARAFGQEASAALEVIQGLGATEAAVRDALPGKRYLHFATHGWVDAGRNALFASLVLTPPAFETSDLANDGFLQLHEIYDLPLQAAELAVLSACETNIGEAVEGEGVFALSRGFLAAGARRVIASQWAVDDASTAALIGAFFEAVVAAERAGLPVDYARALRDAKRSVRQEADWQNPYFWAPFILIGSS